MSFTSVRTRRTAAWAEMRKERDTAVGCGTYPADDDHEIEEILSYNHPGFSECLVLIPPFTYRILNRSGAVLQLRELMSGRRSDKVEARNSRRTSLLGTSDNFGLQMV